MKPLYTQEQFKNSKLFDTLPCECYICYKTFFIKKKQIVAHLRGSKDKCMFCSQKCVQSRKSNKQTLSCNQCLKIFKKIPSQIKKVKNNFCSKSCAVTYQNAHKTYGSKRSKLEIYIESKLLTMYPNINFCFNKKETINSELDIYIPSLKLAIELNGIFHYEPIFGEGKLLQTQNNDHRKLQSCAEKEISLCIIDTSRQKYFKESTSKEFLSIIIEIINNKSKNI